MVKFENDSLFSFRKIGLELFSSFLQGRAIQLWRLRLRQLGRGPPPPPPGPPRGPAPSQAPAAGPGRVPETRGRRGSGCEGEAQDQAARAAGAQDGPGTASRAQQFTILSSFVAGFMFQALSSSKSMFSSVSPIYFFFFTKKK